MIDVFYKTTGSGSVWTEWSFYGRYPQMDLQSVMEEIQAEYGPQFEGDTRAVDVRVEDAYRCSCPGGPCVSGEPEDEFCHNCGKHV